MFNTISEDLSTLKLLAKNGDIESAYKLIEKLSQRSLGPAGEALFSAICKFYGLDTESHYEEYQHHFFTEDVSANKGSKLSAFDDMPTNVGVSIVSCCMDRNENLRKALLTWLKLDIDEIIIVDWSSSTPVSETLKGISDSRIKIVRVENEPKWILTYGFNVGLRLASFDKIFKLDADIKVSPNFLELNTFNEKEFIRGHWKSALDNRQNDQLYVNGSFGCYKKHLLKIGFYNEFIRTNGSDDSNIYYRLADECGLKTKYLCFDSVVHVEQEEHEWIENQDVSKSYFLGEVLPTEFNNQRNKYLVRLLDHWAKWHLQDYSYEGASHFRDISITRFTNDYPIQKHFLKDAACYASLLLIGRKYQDLLWKVERPKDLANEVYQFYLDGIDFKETAAIFGLDETIIVKFISQHEIYENLCHYASSTKNSKNSAKVETLLFFTCSNANSLERREIEVEKTKVIITFLPLCRFERLFELFQQANSRKTESLIKSNLSEQKVFTTSIYDEKEEHRLKEYIDCIEKNLNIFDVICLFYEESSSTFRDALDKRLSAKQHSLSSCCIFFINITERPTFRFIFDFADSVFSGTQIYVSNADVAFEKNIIKVTAKHLNGNFLVLSRKEIVTETQEDDGFIMSQFGLPNTFSADVWIYQSPLQFQFRADFGIGTFHCDSFLNYHIGNSGYKLFNPCLDLQSFHIHDAKFNSSGEKELTQAVSIKKAVDAEVDLCNGDFPLKGVQWCRLKDTLIDSRANQLADWSDVIINIDINPDGSNLMVAMMQTLISLTITAKVFSRNSVWLRLPEEAVHSQVADVVFGFKELLGHKNLLIGIANIGKQELFAKDIDGYQRASVDMADLIASYQAVILENPSLLFGLEGFAFKAAPHFGIHQKAYLLCNLKSDKYDDLNTYGLLKVLTEQDKNSLLNILNELDNRGVSNLKPYIEDIQYT